MDAASLSFREVGDPASPAVLLLHGQLVDGTYYDALAKRLSARYRVLVPDLPAWGRSPPAAPHDAATVLRLLEEGLVARGVRSARVVGSSVGAYHALALALAGRLDVRRLALLGPLAGLDPAGRARFAEYARLAREGVPLGAAAVETAFAPGFRAANPAVCAGFATRIDTMPGAWVAADLQLVAEAPDLRPRLGELHLPVLVRTGALDRSTPLDDVRALAHAIRGCALEVVAGAGHLLLVEDKAATTAAVEACIG